MIAPVEALNFYSPIVENQLRSGRKSATIRLGDKAHKYRKGQLVWVTIGHRHGPRQKIFTAIIDDVVVLPCVPATPTARLRFTISPSISERRMTRIPRACAASTSAFFPLTAAVTTTRSTPSRCDGS